MAVLKKVKRCSHCGSILQDKNKNESGYIDTIILKKYPDGVLLCNNCFKVAKNNNESDSNLALSEDFKTILKKIHDENALVVYVIDLFSFEGCFPSEINDLIEGLDVIVVGTKRDLLPKKANDAELKEYVSHRLRVAKLKVKDVVLTSVDTKDNTAHLFELIEELRGERNVYFVGPSTSGKSTLLKEYLKSFNNNTRLPIVTHTFKNTTLRGLQIPLNTKHSIYEVPGFPVPNSMLGILEKPISNLIVPSKEIKPKKFTLTDKSFLVVSGLSLIQSFSEEKVQITCYFSGLIDLKVKKGDPLKIFNYILLSGNQKNTSFKFRDVNDFDAYDIDIVESGSRDIGILGLGWISFQGNNQKFRIFVPKGIYVYTTRSKIKEHVK